MFIPKCIECDGQQMLSYIDTGPVNNNGPPIYYGPGWSLNADAHLGVISQLVKQGYRVIAPWDYHGLMIDTNGCSFFLAAEMYKAAVIPVIVQHLSIAEMDVIAHSEGGIYTTLAAEICPELRHHLLVNPAGLIGQDSLVSLAIRFAGETLRQLFSCEQRNRRKREILDRANQHFLRSISSSPWRSFCQVLAIAWTPITDRIKKLAGPHKRFGVIATDDDIVFPAGRMQRVIRSLRGAVSYFKRRRGVHNEVFLSPAEFSRDIHEGLMHLTTT